MMAEHPDRILRFAVKGMLPKNRLGRQQIKKLKIYAGPALPHTRRIETVTVAPRYDLRPRATRRDAWRDALRLGKWAWERRAELRQAALRTTRPA
jgi:hypothetical protein